MNYKTGKVFGINWIRQENLFKKNHQYIRNPDLSKLILSIINAIRSLSPLTGFWYFDTSIKNPASFGKRRRAGSCSTTIRNQLRSL